MDKKLLFVCLGNICRSPAAEEIMRQLVANSSLRGTVQVDSAGTYGGHAGNLPDPRMRVAAAHRGYCLEHRSRRITDEDFERFDLIVAMDDTNYERVSRLAPTPEALRKLYRMMEFRRHTSWDHVPDPYYEGSDGFELVLNLLEDACRGLLEDIEQGRV